MIRIAISTDFRGYHINATLIASVLRRASRPVHVRCWCRGFLPESFEQGPLKVEFIPAIDEVSGKFPSYVGSAVFDRLRVIREADDWDRCLIMDYDQVALCDLAPLFDLDFGDSLLAARRHGPGVDMAYAMRTWLKRPPPAGWEHVAGHPYFSMGPLLNLAAMREAGTWGKLMAAQAAFGADENLSLVAATEGRSMDFDRKWNLFPKSDIGGEEAPEGVVHWLGWPKPWHAMAKVWRPDIWEAERSSWEHLRMGVWEKPVAVEVEPDDDRSVGELLKRGWKVRLLTGGAGSPAEELPALSFPDLTVEPAVASRFRHAVSRSGEMIERVRFGPWSHPSEWLSEVDPPPDHVTLRGPLDAAEIERVRALGYVEGCRIRHPEWPAGGPMPRVLEFTRLTEGEGLDATEELNLRRSAEHPTVGVGPARSPGEGRRHREAEHGKAAVAVTAVGSQKRHLRHFLQALRKNFLPGHAVHVFLFTDGEHPGEDDLTAFRVRLDDPARAHLARYRWMLEKEAQFAEFGHLYLMKIAVRIVDRVEREILSDDLVGVLHSGHADRPRAKIRFESNREPVVRGHPAEGKRYFCGSLQGGKRECFLEAVRAMAESIAQDDARGTNAIWGDESHWNRCLIDSPPGTVLGPEYAWRTMGRLPECRPKIAVTDVDPA